MYKYITINPTIIYNYNAPVKIWKKMNEILIQYEWTLKTFMQSKINQRQKDKKENFLMYLVSLR